MRDSRVWEWTPAAGACVEIKQYNMLGQLHPPHPSPGTIFDIGLGILTETFKNKNTTNSGDNGGESWTRVGSAWSYRLSLGFPAGLFGGGPVSPAFAQQLLGSSRRVWMRFYMGDPEFWTSQGRDVRSFIGGLSLVGEVVTRIDVNNHDVVGLNIAGVGIGLLRAMLNDAQAYP